MLKERHGSSNPHHAITALLTRVGFIEVLQGLEKRKEEKAQSPSLIMVPNLNPFISQYKGLVSAATRNPQKVKSNESPTQTAFRFGTRDFTHVPLFSK